MKKTLLDDHGLSTDDDTNNDSHDDGGSLSTDDETTDNEHNSLSIDEYTDNNSSSSADAELKTKKNKIKNKNSCRSFDKFDPNIIGRSYIDGSDDECDDYNDYSSTRCRPPSHVVMESVPVAGMHCLIPTCRFDEDDPIRGTNKNVKNGGKQEGLLSRALRLIRIEDTMDCGAFLLSY